MSFEVAPHLAYDSAGTAAVRRPWQAIGRLNAMLKIPATAEGLAAIEEYIDPRQIKGPSTRFRLFWTPVSR